jgi:hypothetical protein
MIKKIKRPRAGDRSSTVAFLRGFPSKYMLPFLGGEATIIIIINNNDKVIIIQVVTAVLRGGG